MASKRPNYSRRYINTFAAAYTKDMTKQRAYTDGTYTVKGVYGTAKNPNGIIVTLQLADDAIAAVAVTPAGTHKTSIGLQKKFAVAISDEVVGRPIDEVHLDRLAGSSLTTKGFNDAIEKIKIEATQ